MNARLDYYQAAMTREVVAAIKALDKGKAKTHTETALRYASLLHSLGG